MLLLLMLSDCKAAKNQEVKETKADDATTSPDVNEAGKWFS